MLRAGQCTGLLRLLGLVLLLAADSRPAGLEALTVPEAATARSGALRCARLQSRAGHSPARGDVGQVGARRHARTVQPTDTEERGSGARARVGRAEAPEGGGGACMLSPATAEHPGAGPGRASTGNGADARGGEERDSRSRVGRGRPGRNVVAGHVVDVERLASLVMSMGGALSVTAKRRWRVCPSLRPPPVAKAMAWTLSL